MAIYCVHGDLVFEDGSNAIILLDGQFVDVSVRLALCYVKSFVYNFKKKSAHTNNQYKNTTVLHLSSCEEVIFIEYY